MTGDKYYFLVLVIVFGGSGGDELGKRNKQQCHNNMCSVNNVSNNASHCKAQSSRSFEEDGPFSHAIYWIAVTMEIGNVV